jgi:hypothetical protein
MPDQLLAQSFFSRKGFIAFSQRVHQWLFPT